MNDSRSTTFGFVGTGEISKAIVSGLIEHAGEKGEIWLSPRNTTIASELSTRYPNVRVAKENQEVVDNAQRIFLAVRPQDADEVLSSLRFCSEHIAISLIAGYSCEQVKRACGTAPGKVIRAVPFASVANGNCKTLMFPDDQSVRQTFERVGGTIPLSSEEHLETMVAMGATMELFFRVLHTYAQWAADRGIDYASARSYLSNQYDGLVEIARSNDIPFDDLSKQFTTKGGLNELVVTTFEKGHGFDLLRDALDQVERRLLG